MKCYDTNHYAKSRPPSLEIKYCDPDETTCVQRIHFTNNIVRNTLRCGGKSEHAMKVVERIFEHRILQQIEVDDMQFGFMKGKGTTDAIFTVRQMQENFRVKGKKLCFGFLDFEKAFDRVPREVI